MRPTTVALCALVLTGARRAEPQGVRGKELSGIVVAAEPHWAEELAAKVLREQLERHYGLKLQVVSGAAGPAGASYLGRGPALASGGVTGNDEFGLDRVP